MLTCCSLELTMGITGYLAYQNNTLGNVLNNMSLNHWSGVASRAFLSTTMFFAYPMNLYIARHASMVLLFQGTMAHEGDDSIVLMRRDRRIVLTFLLYVLSLIPALLMESTGKVLAMTGAIAGSCLAYIVPGLVYIAVHSTEFIELVHRRWNDSNKLWGYPKRETCNMVTKNGNLAPGKRDVLLWYAFCMPIWSEIAQYGQAKLDEHYEKEDMVSPSIVKPKRVTVVKPLRQVTKNNEQAGARVGGIIRSTSDPAIDGGKNSEQSSLLKPQLGSLYGTSAVAGNEGVAKMIAIQNDMSGNLLRSTSSLTSLEVKNELKDEVPTLIDFLIAIAYIVLGVVAMSFGLLSIACL
jgi:sodium-coupled neutral amino acid transporter 11